MSRSKATSSSQRHASYYQTYQERAAIPDTPLLNVWLLRLMAAKRSNLCLSADVHSTSQLLEVADECGDSICMLKTHADIVYDFGERTMKGLMEIAARKKFLIFEDRKFGDIGSTVQAQYAAGPHRIASWASIVDAHIFPGPAIVSALKSAAVSAASHYNSSRSTEITGGNAGSYFGIASHAEHDTDDDSDEDEEDSNENDDSDNDDDDSDDEEAEDDSDEDDKTASQPIPIRKPLPHKSSSQSASSLSLSTRPPDLDDRKSSVISISTTISSSTEYISPPPTTRSPPSARQPSTHAPSSPSASSRISTPDLPSTGPAPLSRGLLLLAQMSSADNLLDGPYTAKAVAMARAHRDFVLGFVAQRMLNAESDDNFLVLTPGVSLPPADEDEDEDLGAGAAALRLAEPKPMSSAKAAGAGAGSTSKKPPQRSSTASAPVPPPSKSQSQSQSLPSAENTGADGLGQQYNTPRDVIVDNGVDVIIVGRGILGKEDRRAEAERYRREGWAAYLERVGGGVTGGVAAAAGKSGGGGVSAGKAKGRGR